MDWRLHKLVADRKTPAGVKRKNRAWRPALEVLEQRSMLAASPALPDIGLNAPIGPQQGITAPTGAIVLSAASGTAANQTAINNATAGATIYFQAGTYADLSIQPKNDQTFIGQFGAILTSQQKVHAFFGSGTGITINNLIVDGYKTASQQFAIEGSDYWHVDDVEVRNSTAEGVLIGSHSSLTNSYVHDNGQMGIAADSANNHCVDVLISNCLISHNNPQDAFDVSFEAGGSKFWNVNGLTVTHCEFSNNVGNGIWMDGDLDGGGNTNVTITNTWSHDNLGIGIFQEIGGSALITNNLLENNGSATFEGVGIELDDSESVTITNNVVRNNSNGILLESYARTDTVHKVQNDVVTNNTIVANQGNTGVLYFGRIQSFATGITFDYNQYTFTGSALFAWNGSWSYSWSQWQAAGNDSHSTFSSSMAADTTPPTVTGISPSGGATNVATNGTVSVTFSEAMNASTINSNTVLLMIGNTAVAASVSYNSANNTATLIPQSALASSTTYTIVIEGGSAGVTDLAGNALVSDNSSTFTTSAQRLKHQKR